MTDDDELDYIYWKSKFEELQSKIKNWHDRIKKATMNVSTHLFREVLDVVKEMEKETE